MWESLLPCSQALSAAHGPAILPGSLGTGCPCSSQRCCSLIGEPGLAPLGKTRDRKREEFHLGNFKAPIFLGTASMTRSSALVLAGATPQSVPNLVPAVHHLLPPPGFTPDCSSHHCGLARHLQGSRLGMVMTPVPSLPPCWVLLDGPWESTVSIFWPP